MSLVALQAITALQAPAGAIENISYRYPDGSQQAAPPSSVPLGLSVGGEADMVNTGTVRQRMYMVLTLKRPDGTVKSGWTSEYYALYPVGAGPERMRFGWSDVADQAGVWKMVIQVYGEIW